MISTTRIRKGRDSTAGVRQVGDALDRALAEMSAGASELRNLPGKGRTTLDFGMYRIREHSAQMGMSAAGIDYVERKVREQYTKAILLTESPIERSMIAALVTGRWVGCETIPPLVHNSAKDSLELLPLGDVVIVPQMAFVRFRLDFGIALEKDGRRQIVAVECDGSQFHLDAQRERFRDAYLNSWAIPTFRFKGSEIHEDAVAAADEVIAAICAWKAS